jgi:hypothetical protein
MTDETRTPDEIRSDIEQTRAELGDTVEALGAKSDVKGRAKAKVEEVSGQGAAARVRENPAPLAIGAALVVGFLIDRRRAR